MAITTTKNIKSRKDKGICIVRDLIATLVEFLAGVHQHITGVTFRNAIMISSMLTKKKPGIILPLELCDTRKRG